MSQELQKALAAWLQAMLTATQNVAGQIPPMLWEKVTLGRIYESFLLTVLVAAAAGVPVLAFRVTREWPRTPRDEADPAPARTVLRSLSLAASVILTMFSVAQVSSVLEVWVAPRVYLVNWIKSMI